MSALNSVHQANAQAIAKIQAMNQDAEERHAAEAERSLRLAELHREKVVEEAKESANKRSLDTVV